MQVEAGQMETHRPIRMAMCVMTMMTGQNLTDNVDAQAQNCGDIASNLSSALVIWGRDGRVNSVD